MAEGIRLLAAARQLRLRYDLPLMGAMEPIVAGFDRRARQAIGELEAADLWDVAVTTPPEDVVRNALARSLSAPR